jgi:hypothetical protein
MRKIEPLRAEVRRRRRERGRDRAAVPDGAALEQVEDVASSPMTVAPMPISIGSAGRLITDRPNTTPEAAMAV